MNVFEDLVVELKEQNLLEETIVERSGSGTNGNGKQNKAHDKPSFESKDVSELSASKAGWDVPAAPATVSNSYRPSIEALRRGLTERYQALQFTEYVLAAAENRVSNSAGVGLDDLQLKKALHTFEQASADPESDEFFEAESALVSRLEGWQAVLAERDRNISVEALRHYAEQASPPLSPQTLFSLIRFYRGLPFDRTTRSKFDFVVTRLFSKFADRDRRDLLCPRGEITKHLKQRYADWSGRGSYRADDADTTLLVLSFDDFISEVNNASLNEMRSSNLFERICELKENSGPSFFLPEVAAAAVECNIKIANKVIELVWAEMQRSDGSLPARLLKIDNETLSEAAGRTLELGKLHGEIDEPEPEPSVRSASPRMTLNTDGPRTRAGKPKKAKAEKGSKSNLFGVNRWLLLATILVVIASAGIYVWSEYYAGEEASTSGVKVVDLDKPELKKYIKVSKVSNNMMYAVVTAEYEKLDADGQREYLQQLLQTGPVKGYAKVTFLNEQGKQIAYASADRIETPKK